MCVCMCIYIYRERERERENMHNQQHTTNNNEQTTKHSLKHHAFGLRACGFRSCFECPFHLSSALWSW